MIILAMDLLAFSLILAVFCRYPLAIAQTTPPVSSRITVVGAVYCDVCLNDDFSKNSYFMSGVDVHIQCKFNADSPKTSEMITFSVNRTTDKNGLYKLDIPSVDGVDCVDGPPIQSFCQASLLGSSSSKCNVPTLKATTTGITVKARQENLCVYSFTPLSFRPNKRNDTLCSQQAEKIVSQAKYLENFTFPFPSRPPSLPFPFPFTSPPPSLPFPFPSPPPSLPFPFPSPPPSLPFPFPFPSPPPSLPFPFPFPSPPPSLPFPFPFPSPPPSLPFPFSPIFHPPPPPPSFSLGDPSTWFPHIPLVNPPPPPPPAFDLRDPRTWTPSIPPFTPPNFQKNNP